jgi:hypothetical protein
MNILRFSAVWLVCALCLTTAAHAAELALPTYLPNYHGKAVTTPVAWGASGNVAFMGVGGTYPSPYQDAADGAAVFGFGVGDPEKLVGLQVAFVSVDISEWKEYSMGLHLTRDLGHASAVGVGIESIMLTDGGDAKESYYIVYSQALQSDMFINRKTGKSKMHYSLGAGTNRFGDKSPVDIAAGKGEHGTYLFANVAYEVATSFNVIADWNGLNLNAGVAKTFIINGFPIVTTVGLADLTKNSGDGVRTVFAVGTGLKMF